MTDTQADHQKRRGVNWAIWFQWVLATTLGWLVGWGFIGEVGIGVVVGLAQWFVLRELLDRAGWWVLVTTVGWVIGWAVIVTGGIVAPEAGLIASLITGLVVGAAVGLAQWVILQRSVYYAAWWVPANIIGWTFGLTGVLGGTIAGAVIGAITGFMLDILLRNPRPGVHPGAE